ncbi:MAG TPA: glycosyltransferase family 4 protein, partial [Methylomirabilota bacterium]|nr:glycosyltransferase family 4 protein [Methylomirabilota bacterium]
MRFTITLERFDLARGGAEVATLRLVRELAARGHQVHLITSGVAVELPAGVTVELIRLPPCGVAWQQISFARQVRRRLARGGCDLSLAACGRGFSEDVLWAQNGAFRGALEGQARSYYFSPVLRWLRRHQHWFSLRSRVYLELERRHFARRPLPFVLAPSRMVAEQFVRIYRLPAERIRVANYRVDGRRFSPASLRPLRAEARQRFGLGPSELAIVCVAQNFRRKGVRPLIEAAARLRHRREDFRVLVAGLDLRAAQPYL